ncbi:hypothetical protein Tco_1129696 [Tanacetum coccineum]
MSTSKGENEVVSKPSDISNKEHTTQSTRKMIAAESPQLIVHNTPDPTTLTTQVHAKEDTNIQADDAVFNAYDSLIRLLHQRQLATDPEMCMFTLIVSKSESKNIKEVMVDHAWIESMQEELH